MSRQLDLEAEVREAAKRDTLVRALDFGLPGALDAQGIHLLGFAVKYDAFSCLITLKADVGGVQSVAFVGSDTIINCVLRAYSDAQHDALKWRPDRYHQK